MSQKWVDGPLTGLRVVELGTLLAGPTATRVLAEFGAEVIKVELPGKPDPLRVWGVDLCEGRGLYWPVLSRNKRCITLNLNTPKGQDIFRQMIGEFDVLVENFRPGTLERWGLGPDDLLRMNPRLIVARVSGYGQTGPYARRAGFASVGEAMGGLRHINGYPGQPPPRAGISLGDTLAAMFTVQGILLALHARSVHGAGGQVVDASIVESCFALMEGAVPEFDRLGLVKEPSGSGLRGVVPSNIYKSSDDKWMIIAANADNVFRRLCSVMGQPELADDPRFSHHEARAQNTDAIDAIVAAWAACHSAAEIDHILNEAGVVCGPIYTIADIFRDPHFRAREMIIPMHDERLGELAGPGIVPKLSLTPGRVRWAGDPEPGYYNQEFYGRQLGLSAADIQALQDEGVI